MPSLGNQYMILYLSTYCITSNAQGICQQLMISWWHSIQLLLKENSFYVNENAKNILSTTIDLSAHQHSFHNNSTLKVYLLILNVFRNNNFRFKIGGGGFLKRVHKVGSQN